MRDTGSHGSVNEVVSSLLGYYRHLIITILIFDLFYPQYVLRNQRWIITKIIRILYGINQAFRVSVAHKCQITALSGLVRNAQSIE